MNKRIIWPVFNAGNCNWWPHFPTRRKIEGIHAIVETSRHLMEERQREVHESLLSSLTNNAL